MDRVGNEVVRYQTDYQNSNIDYVPSRHIIWYAHVLRMDEDRLPKWILNCMLEGSRRRVKVVAWMRGITKTKEIGGRRIVR